MQVFFLGASVPLTKSFSRDANGAIEKSAYPMVKDFTSYEETVHTPEDFLRELQAHAALGHCLLKGKLNRRLNEESRAGATTPLDTTQWSCFDLDNIESIESIEQFIRDVLPPAFHDVDCVIQHSASAGITDEKGIRAHLFFLHEREFVPEQAKLFVTDLNLVKPVLKDQLALTAAGTSLRYRLDRTVNQNDKIIYIATPELGEGITDTLGLERITLRKGSRATVAFDWSATRAPQAIEAAVDAEVERLREAMGLPRKRGRYRVRDNGEQIMVNPDRAVVTGAREARGFTYLNLNGGDSWGYYYATENPRYLRNFKGEPTVVLADMLPEYWAQLQDRIRGKHGRRPFVFRHLATDTFWNGVYDPVNNRIESLAQTAKTNVPDFFAQFHAAPPEVIEDWTFEFQPQQMVQVSFKDKFCNRWSPTEYMRMAPEGGLEIPPIIFKIIYSVAGGDAECIKHFLNWLACIFQHRTKTMTAWVFSGVEGTGKGVLYHKILVPLFGAQYCVQKQIAALDDRFNADLAQCLIYNFDEAKADSSTSARKAYDRLKNMITETTQEIRAMRSNPVQVENYTNLLFTSNNYDAMGISATDRRFNVCPRQEVKIELTEAEVDQITGELPVFAQYLLAFQVDINQARTALNNEAKAAMREAGQDWIDQMVTALVEGNLEYFLQHAEAPVDGAALANYSNYVEIMKRWLKEAHDPTHLATECVVTGSELYTAYQHLGGTGIAMGVAKFGRFLSHRNVKLQPNWSSHAKKTVRATRVAWRLTAEQRARYSHILGVKQSDSGPVTIGPWNAHTSSA